MKKHRTRPIFFQCAAVKEGKLVSKTIQAASVTEAVSAFEQLTSIKPEDVAGPFYKKKKQILEVTRDLKFTHETKRAIFNEWEVNAMLLKEPADHAYLVFIRRVDDKKVPAPKGTVVVPVFDLRFM